MGRLRDLWVKALFAENERSRAKEFLTENTEAL
jgi:hypothetical protein